MSPHTSSSQLRALVRTVAWLTLLLACQTDTAQRQNATADSASVAVPRASISTVGANDLTELSGKAAEAGRAVSAYSQEEEEVALVNESVAVTVEMSGAEAGLVTFWDAKSQQPLVQGTPALVTVEDVLSLTPVNATDYSIRETNENAFGHGLSLKVDLVDSQGQEATAVIMLGNDADWFTYQIAANRSEPFGARYFSEDSNGRILLGADPNTLVDPDPILRADETGLGKPLIVWDMEKGRSLLFSVLDQTEVSPWFSLETIADAAAAHFTFELFPSYSRHVQQETERGARLFISYTRTRNPALAAASYREVMAQLYPPVPMPDWVKFQWLSWYVYFIDVDDTAIRKHIDYIAADLADLGDWHVLLDAGWYVTEGRPGADWRTIDFEKFPAGIRQLVDYAHERGLRVVLYFSLPYLDDNPEEGNWNGLRGLIDQAQDWLIPLGEEDGIRKFVYDLDHPGFQRFLTEIMENFFVKYDVDGIKVDGLGNAADPTLAYSLIYERASALKPDVYSEGGWRNPVYAHPFNHTFRFGDEFPVFEFFFPNSGLREHIDYGLFQSFVLGQRANIGAISGDPNRDALGLRWLEAALALGSQVSLSFDLSEMTAATLSQYRARLVQYEPFAGPRRISGDDWPPSAFSYQHGGNTYLGVLNRGTQSTTLDVSLREHGVDDGSVVTAYDATIETYSRQTETLRAALTGEEFRLFVLRSEPGIVWTNSSAQNVQVEGNELRLTVQGPAALKGFIDLLIPSSPQDVQATGEALPVWEEGAETGYIYDETTRILRIHYTHDNAHELYVRW